MNSRRSGVSRMYNSSTFLYSTQAEAHFFLNIPAIFSRSDVYTGIKQGPKFMQDREGKGIKRSLLLSLVICMWSAGAGAGTNGGGHVGGGHVARGGCGSCSSIPCRGPPCREGKAKKSAMRSIDLHPHPSKKNRFLHRPGRAYPLLNPDTLII